MPHMCRAHMGSHRKAGEWMYADTAYYKNEYGGEFDGTDAALAKLLVAASLYVDGMTLWKTRRLGAVGALSDRRRDALKRACCLQADFLHTHGTEPEAVKNLKIFDASVTYADKAGASWFSAEAALLLRGAGLVERVVG